MNSLPDKCPKCGATITDGLCRPCLLLAGVESTPASAGARWTPPTPEELEAQLPKYRVLELLGRGGMGVVYKGWQTSLERDVAIKVLPPSLTEEGSPFIARFRQEARTMARLSHPSIVSVYDFDETPGGLCYIVMEFIEGTDVQRMVASQGKLPPEHALAIAMYVCDALAYAHEHGIIHRDIKPANVMVDAQGRVKVTDFGLAKAIHADAALLTGTNLTMGTPGYVAPEALIMGMGVDARADLYAVGVMLYTMLTGKVPHGRFEAASERVPGLDPRFDDIVNRAMQDDREARYANAAELGADLSALLTRPVDQASAPFAEAASSPHVENESRAPTPATSGARRSSRRSRARAAAALLCLAAPALCALALFVWKPWSHPGSPPVAIPRASPTDQGAEAKAFKNAASPTNAHILAAATTPAPEAAAPPITPPPAPHPSVSSTPLPSPPAPSEIAKPPTVVEKWFAELDAPHEEEFRKQVLKPFETGLASLRARYRAAVDAAIAKASAANQLADALVWRTEKRAFESAQNFVIDDTGVAVNVKDLRVLFRQELAKLDLDRTTRARALLAPYDAILAQNQTLLTQRARLDDALLLKKKRDEIALAWLGSLPPTTDGAATRPESAKSGSVLLVGKAQPFVNSLGMKFVPVPIAGGPTDGKRVLFSVWDTRVQDYGVFVRETTRKWPEPDFPQGPTHPAVKVSWDDAQLFCQWLTDRERAAERLPAGFSYRLPSDHEWSCAVGIGAREDAEKPPIEKNQRINDAFPWGRQWPPRAGAGNYAGEEMRPAVAAGRHTHIKSVLNGYRDGYVETAPVGSFAVNQFGLFDMGGNVWQWCEDWYDQDQKGRVLRGASWSNNRLVNLLSRSRSQWRAGSRNDDGGFRCVLAPASAPAVGVFVAQAPGLPGGESLQSQPASGASPAGQPPFVRDTAASAPAPQSATKEMPWVNTLGMKFVPVPITGGPTDGQRVLFSAWDTRVQDYAIFAQETNGERPKPDFEQGLTHPVVDVSWEDAQRFCRWLTGREQAAERLPAGFSYRLPSDHEWSCAAELGAKEDAARLPSEKSGRIGDVFPWGAQWPPPAGAGNYAGEELQPALTAGKYTYAKGVIAGYNDGFVNTSPVGSFAANRFGLFDMGGNILQWCEDWFDTEQKTRVLRGSPWNYNIRGGLLSSSRAHFAPGNRYHYYGFRCVLAPPAAAPAAAPLLASKAAGAPRAFGPGQSIDLLALPGLAGLDLGSAKGAHVTVIHKEAGRLRIEGDKYSGTIYAPVTIPGGEYELEVGVGNELGSSVLTRIPLPRSHVVVVFNRLGRVELFSKQNRADLIPDGSAWPAGRPISLKLRVKFGAEGVDDELEAQVGNHRGAVWHGRLEDYQFDENLSEGRLGLTIAPDVKTIESFTLRMIQGEATLLPPGVRLLPSSAPSSSPNPQNRGANLAASGPATPRPVTDSAAPMELKFTAMDGRKVDLEKLRGKVVLIDFWASWCQPCMLEVPHVVEAYHKFHDKGFEIVGISFDQDKTALRRATGQKSMTWPQYFDGKVWQNEYGLKFGIHSIPTMWLIDRQGRVATTNGREDLAGQVEKLLAGEAH